ncbi:(2Fe-2S)-binding protein [Lutibaculum baratangense]|uniref:Uncharacterized protein n=1 Tax=Lutibaculum baratangense AMV1 TaxID=631454 RepID=V4RAK8_9HYPH|nr:(2Fe-2S)-binding protein [Lutibaculum baratangense]ESR22409.1 hypothetical protein N177_4139 [Lutibaculum baratangense AMV1]
MIVCHCNVITRKEIEEVVDRLLAADPYCVVTPGRIYHRLGKRGRCCNCFPLVVQILVERVERTHREEGLPACDGPAPGLSKVA